MGARKKEVSGSFFNTLGDTREHRNECTNIGDDQKKHRLSIQNGRNARAPVYSSNKLYKRFERGPRTSWTRGT